MMRVMVNNGCCVCTRSTLLPGSNSHPESAASNVLNAEKFSPLTNPESPPIQADSAGVCEAIKAALASLPQHSVAARVLLSGAGSITTSDLDLAAASGQTGLWCGLTLV